MLYDVIKSIFVCAMTIVAADDLELGGDRTHLGMRLLRHGSGILDDLVSISQDRESGISNGFSIGGAVIWSSRASAASGVECKDKAEINTCICDEIFLYFLETTCLPCAARSESRCHKQNVVFAVKVPHANHLTTLVNQLYISDHASVGALSI